MCKYLRAYKNYKMNATKNNTINRLYREGEHLTCVLIPTHILQCASNYCVLWMVCVSCLCEYLHFFCVCICNYDCTCTVAPLLGRYRFGAKPPQLVKFSLDEDLRPVECHALLSEYTPEHMKKNKILQKLFIKYVVLIVWCCD